jgi:hypothetical protein
MPRTEEGVVLHDDVLEIIAYLQDCFDKLNRGEEDRILGDPFYRRPEGKPNMTDEEIDRVVAAIDEEFAHEIGAYPGYHRNRSGANAPADFQRLSPRARRAMVEGLEAILVRHQAAKAAQAQEEQATTA